MIRAEQFSKYERGTLFLMLLDAYSSEESLTSRYLGSWREFDSFVYNNMDIMDPCGFVSEEGGEAIGFASWDPRGLPDSVELGHNCVKTAFKGKGRGKEQLVLALARVTELGPMRILVKTGASPFFLPARRMYESAGFRRIGMKERSGGMEFDVMEYELPVRRRE